MRDFPSSSTAPIPKTGPRLGRELADALSALGDRWLIQVDELPVFLLKLLAGAEIDGPQRTRVREFLYWMRRLRLEYPSVKWMLAGSVGLDTVAARLNLADTINDLRIVTLGAYTPETAHALLRALGASYNIELSDAVRQHLIDRVGWPIPYYLQLAFHELRGSVGAGVATEAGVDAAFGTLLDPAHKAYFDFWRQRLHDELGQPDSGFAIGLLSSACHDDEGASRDTLAQKLSLSITDPALRDAKLQYLLDVLQSDGYLVEHQRRLRFRFALLRDYWRARVAT